MSTNVDSVEYLSGELTISEEGRAWLAKADEGELDEDWYPEIGPTAYDDGTVDVAWSGEGSGNAVSYGVLKKFFAFTHGTAEFVFTWEGGDFFTGYRVVDGVVTEHEVEMKLGKEIKS
jgi:hypothetical protein